MIAVRNSPISVGECEKKWSGGFVVEVVTVGVCSLFSGSRNF